MLSEAQMREQSVSPWMLTSHKPELCDWLAPEPSPGWKERLSAVGNIVVPHMANFAANLLKEIWISQPSQPNRS